MKFNIKGFEWEIVESGDSEEVYKDKDGVIRLGLTEYFKKKITIHQDLTQKEKERTLVHELTHAFIEQYGFRSAELNEELVCDFIGTYMEDIYNIKKLYFEVVKL